MPRKAISKEIVSFNVDEIVEYGIKSYMLPYIKIFEVRSKSEVASISHESFENKSDIELLFKFIGEGQC